MASINNINSPDLELINVRRTADYIENRVNNLTDLRNIEDNAHFVQFYEDAEFIISAINQFINSGDTAIVVASAIHRNQLEKVLLMNGLNVKEATKQGLLVYLDAFETLSQFMVDGLPNRTLFFDIIGTIVKNASKNGGKLRIFGEMVALLWAEGNQEAAVAIEELWNELQQYYTFSLFCAYPIHGFDNKSHKYSFERIEQTHSRVIPSESYSDLSDEDTKLREIALLQQQAQALISEIKEHKKTEALLVESVAALKVSEEFNRKIIENSADCIKILDLQGNLLSMNQPGCKAFEIDDLSMYIGKDYRDFWQGESYKQADRAILSAKNGNIGRFQAFCPTAKGTAKWWDVVVTPIYNNEGNIDKLLGIMRDISPLKDLEMRKEDFISATSHELKTPLTSQKAYIQLLQREVDKNNEEKYKKYISKISEQSDKLTKLVANIVNVSKIANGKLLLNFSFFTINEMLQNTIVDVQLGARNHRITLKGKISKNVYGDKEKLAQVITILLSNAIKYSPRNSEIFVYVTEENNRAKISVQDFGIGIEKKNHKKIFGRFFRVNDIDEITYPGLGIGLYLASEIVRQHKSQIMVASEKGKGSMFSFYVPLS